MWPSWTSWRTVGGRYTAAASSAGTVRTPDVSYALHVLDDHGLLILSDNFVCYRQRNCPTLAKDASISRIVYQPVSERDDPTRWRTWQLPG